MSSIYQASVRLGIVQHFTAMLLTHLLAMSHILYAVKAPLNE